MSKNKSPVPLALHFGPALDDDDLTQILALQALNHSTAVSAAEARAQGFVTVRHDLLLLRAMNDQGPHAVARHGREVVGYALAMLPAFASQVPVLASLFETLDGLVYRGRPLASCPYFVMGQVCVAKAWRGQGVLDGLYAQLRRQMQGRFEVVVTEIATRNVRSMQAHARVGFEVANVHTAPDGEEWAVVWWPIGGA